MTLTFPPLDAILSSRGGDVMLDERYWVEKSKALVWAQFQDYSPGELKILDTYLSRIDPRNPESSLVHRRLNHSGKHAHPRNFSVTAFDKCS